MLLTGLFIDRLGVLMIGFRSLLVEGMFPQTRQHLLLRTLLHTLPAAPPSQTPRVM